MRYNNVTLFQMESCYLETAPKIRRNYNDKKKHGRQNVTRLKGISLISLLLSRQKISSAEVYDVVVYYLYS